MANAPRGSTCRAHKGAATAQPLPLGLPSSSPENGKYCFKSCWTGLEHFQISVEHCTGFCKVQVGRGVAAVCRPGPWAANGPGMQLVTTFVSPTPSSFYLQYLSGRDTVLLPKGRNQNWNHSSGKVLKLTYSCYSFITFCGPPAHYQGHKIIIEPCYTFTVMCSLALRIMRRSLIEWSHLIQKSCRIYITQRTN